MTQLHLKDRIKLSALWAAYGDALGFVTELASTPEAVTSRSGVTFVRDTLPWKRRVGGRASGVDVSFPAGTYSDDTQLRLATSRCVRPDGSFDVASFAKVELPAWGNYALGAGIGSREAAANLAKTNAQWFANIFKTQRTEYVQGGGNGAAMRIQPHVWAARHTNDYPGILRDVLRNSICTHGHVRGFVGACFHALTLAYSLDSGKVADEAELHAIVGNLSVIGDLLRSDRDLALFWIPEWEAASKTSLTQALRDVFDELKDALSKVFSISAAVPPSLVYEQAVDSLGARENNSRGSGIKTAVLASYLAFLYQNETISNALAVAANLLGSDTDSIATMAGAILGATTSQDLRHPLQDFDYICDDARRLTAIRFGEEASSFSYPDLRSWRPSKTAIDAVTMTDDGLVLNGVARVRPMDDMPSYQADPTTTYRWLKLSFGQSILAKVRNEPVYSGAVGLQIAASRSRPNKQPIKRELTPVNLHGNPSDRHPTSEVDARRSPQNASINDITDRLIKAGFPAQAIGECLLGFAESGRSDYLEAGISTLSILLKAYAARNRNRKPS